MTEPEDAEDSERPLSTARGACHTSESGVDESTSGCGCVGVECEAKW